MGFASGSVSFRRFSVLGKSPAAPDESLLAKLAENALRPGEIGMPEEIEYGWSGGRHVLDAQFSFEHNVFADAISFAMRVDTNKVPSELKKAWQLMEEDAAAAQNPSGFISKNQKREVRESIRRKADDELRSGQFRRSKLVPVLWDLPAQMIYSPASISNFEKLAELFERTFGLELSPLSSGKLALANMESMGRRRDYEDARPTRFVHGPTGEGEYPEYPWVAKGPEPKDFLGNEFLLWLWHEADHRGGALKTEADPITVYIDRALDVDCAYGQTGRDFLRGDGPSRMPEARDALRSGKLPRKAGLVIDAFRQQYTLTLNAESLAMSGVKLPDVEDAESARVLLEERIALIRDLGRAIDALFESFLRVRASSAWEGQVGGIRKWILEPVKKTVAA
ncbi:MAG TPA: hypothetical protein VK797_04680 [Tepidisphaeraceae bacterium]|nr:hypothetical protein [Tepidisphaeraceae bacterium]